MGFESGQLLKVILRATKGDDQQVNTFHYDLNAGWDPLTGEGLSPQALADRFRDDVRPGWISRYRSDWTIEPVEVVDEFDPLNPTRPRSAWSSGSATPGTNTDLSPDLLPPNCSALVTLKTDHIGRRNTGRLWLGGSFTEDLQAGGSWSSGYQDSLAAIMDTIPLQPDIQEGPPITGAQANWCVYSRTARALNQDPYASHVQFYIVRPLVHMLRSRALYA